MQEILALTFTEKAAAEMKDRVRQALATAEGGDETARFRDDLMWAGISTIHSFCTRILREYALEAGLEPGFAVIESYELAEMTEETLYRLLYTPLPETVRTAVLRCLRTLVPGNCRRRSSPSTTSGGTPTGSFPGSRRHRIR